MMVSEALTMSGDIFPASRIAGGTSWSNCVGVLGGIPARSTVYISLSSTVSVSQLNAHIQACPSNQTVYLESGTYAFASVVSLKSGVTLRGAGIGSTIITNDVPTVVKMESLEPGDSWGTPVLSNHISILSGITQGATNLIVSATNLAGGVQGLVAGRLAFIDQLNDTNTSSRPTCNDAGLAVAGAYTSVASPNRGADRYKNQVVRIVAVSGNTVTIDPPIATDIWDTNQLTQMWQWTVAPMESAGVESMSINMPAYNHFIGNVDLFNTYNCWIKDVKTVGGRRMLRPHVTVRTEIRGCTITGTVSADPYPISLENSGGVLVEDNSIADIQCSGAHYGLVMWGVTPAVIGYNYFTNHGGGSFMAGSIAFHGAHPSMVLMEGNSGVMTSIDNQWGSSEHNVSFRNRWSGTDEVSGGYRNYVQAIAISATNRFMSVAGDVLGTTGVNTFYESVGQSSACHEDGRIYFMSDICAYCTGTFDDYVTNSLLRAVNWTSATATNSGVVWGGFANSDLPKSLYLSQKPDYFGFLEWPPVSPTNAAYASSRTNIPAGYRWINGTNPPETVVNNTPRLGRINLRLRP